MLTREYPPEIYGGAGVHVAHLVEELSRLVDVDVHCFGRPRGDRQAHAHQPWPAIPSRRADDAALQAMSVDLLMAAATRHADVVHSHTWYASLGGHCPSDYEPFGLTNLEAMACELPVVASALGGIPEIVVDGETGFLVPLDPDPAAFATALAARIDELLADQDRAAAMGRRGRQRAVDRFGWPVVAARTVRLYEQVLACR